MKYTSPGADWSPGTKTWREVEVRLGRRVMRRLKSESESAWIVREMREEGRTMGWGSWKVDLGGSLTEKVWRMGK